MNTLADTYKQLFDIETVQENLKKMYDVKNFQENMEQFYNFDAIREGWTKALENDPLAPVRDAMENMTSNQAVTESVEQGVKISSDLVANNAHALSDAIVLQATRTRDSIDGFIKQANAMAKVGSVQEAIEIQQAYAAEVQESATEFAQDISGIVSHVAESNIKLLQDAAAPVTEAVQQATAPKTKAKPAPKKAPAAARAKASPKTA